MTSITFERALPRRIALPVVRPELVALLALAALLALWGLERNGYANEYYSAAVRAMSTSWHAFAFGSFDAAGVMTVDKPPLALWVQALAGGGGADVRARCERRRPVRLRRFHLGARRR